jgi:hypothetical protein
VHFHVAVPDGVFELPRGAARARFHPLPRPTPVELQLLTERTSARILQWLKRHHLLAERQHDAERAREPSALDALLAGSLGLRELTTLPCQRRASTSSHDDQPLAAESRSARRGARSSDFDVHAAVLVPASDREGRERLLRSHPSRLVTAPRRQLRSRAQNPRARRPCFISRYPALYPCPVPSTSGSHKGFYVTCDPQVSGLGSPCPRGSGRLLRVGSGQCSLFLGTVGTRQAMPTVHHGSQSRSASHHRRNVLLGSLVGCSLVGCSLVFAHQEERDDVY